MLKKAYLEITNVCNLACSFCHGTKREKMFMSVENFKIAAEKIRPHAEYLYFHLMGEPLLHPELETLFAIAADLGFKVIITTNGTLLKRSESVLLGAKALHKVSISVHSFEGNKVDFSSGSYLDNCVCFAKKLSGNGKICVLRLWNLGNSSDSDSFNNELLDGLSKSFPKPWKQVYSGYKLCDRVFVEWGNRFEWPDEASAEVGEKHSCYGLRDQIGVLCDGTVVPCCLDADGVINLGNIFESDLQDILNSTRATELRKSFECKKVTEELCKRCGFAARFV